VATLAAIAALCQDAAIPSGAGEEPLLDRLAALVDQSLLQVTPSAEGEPRFTMLETLREFALEQVEAAGETARIRQRHAAYYVRPEKKESPGTRRAWHGV
jgi:predicted ATPase